MNKEGYKESVLFCYSTIHLTKTDKIRFYYALKGRDGKSGIVKEYSVDHLGRTVLLVSAKFAADVENFLILWKCAYEKREVLIR